MKRKGKKNTKQAEGKYNIEQKSTMRYHFTPINMAVIKKQKIKVGEGVERLEPSCIAGWECKMVQHYGKQYGGFSKS